MLENSEAARKRLEAARTELSSEEGDLANERMLRKRLERKLQIAEDSLKRLDGALRRNGVKLDVDVFADVKTLLSFFEERAEEAKRDATRIDIMKAALKATGNVLSVTFTTSGDPRNDEARMMGCTGGCEYGAPRARTRSRARAHEHPRPPRTTPPTTHPPCPQGTGR